MRVHDGLFSLLRPALGLGRLPGRPALGLGCEIGLLALDLQLQASRFYLGASVHDVD
jgi:hypothetical protein